MATTTTPRPQADPAPGDGRYDVAVVKRAATGRWPEILSAVGGIPRETLDGRHHPCLWCGGTDRFRLVDEAAGAVFCNQCYHEKNGDGIAAIQRARGVGFREALALIGQYLGIQPSRNGKPRRKGKREGAIYASVDAAVKALSRELRGKPAGTWRYDNFFVVRIDLPTPPRGEAEEDVQADSDCHLVRWSRGLQARLPERETVVVPTRQVGSGRRHLPCRGGRWREGGRRGG